MPGANFEASGDKSAVTTAEGTAGAEDAGGGADAIGGALAMGGALFMGGALIIGGVLAIPEPWGVGVGAGFGLPPHAKGASETATSAEIMLLPTQSLFMGDEYYEPREKRRSRYPSVNAKARGLTKSDVRSFFDEATLSSCRTRPRVALRLRER